MNKSATIASSKSTVTHPRLGRFAIGAPGRTVRERQAHRVSQRPTRSDRLVAPGRTVRERVAQLAVARKDRLGAGFATRSSADRSAHLPSNHVEVLLHAQDPVQVLRLNLRHLVSVSRQDFVQLRRLVEREGLRDGEIDGDNEGWGR